MPTMEDSTVVGLRLLLEAGLISEGGTPNKDATKDFDGSNAKSFFADNKRVGFVDERVVDEDVIGKEYIAAVKFIDLGGKRLHRGLSCPEVFASFKQLRILNLAGTDIPLADMTTVLNGVSSSIECVYLGGNGLGNAGALVVANWLAATSSGADNGQSLQSPPLHLIKLDLRYNDIGSEGMTSLCKALESSTTGNVKFLHLEGNKIGNDGCQALSALLKNEHCTLQELFLGANNIEATGATHLASALVVNTTLSKLYLEGNDIGFDGASAFCDVLEGLKENKKVLKYLFADNNNMGKEVAMRLARALNSDTAIPDSLV